MPAIPPGSDETPLTTILTDEEWAPLRRELIGYAYRMLGSPFDAEDAVQETMLRAWRARHRYDRRRSTPRTWVYAIAANVCRDMLRGRTRRSRAVDLAPPSQPGTELGIPLAADRWLEPFPESLPADDADPADITIAREGVQLAFMAVLQQLPPYPRSVLIFRDVLGWRSNEVAVLLERTPSSVNSALQRARAAIRAANPDLTDPLDPTSAGQRELLERYVEAFQRDDVDTLVSLLAYDATMSMPPFTWWLSGRSAIEQLWRTASGVCDDSLLVPTVANGLAAFGHYVPSDGGGATARALQVIETRRDRIVAMTSFLDTSRIFPLFGLPPELVDTDLVATPR